MTQPSTPPPYPSNSSFQPTQPPPPKRNVSSNSAGSVKETIESILIAFILAFIFRAFIVEAFVIPTGSMAPTLLGAHMRFRCDDCGYVFDANYNAPHDKNGDPIIGSNAVGEYANIRCPNCGNLVRLVNPTNPDNSGLHPPVAYGDRILVLKYLYLLQHPQRWDVVVFKTPDRDPNNAPPTYTQNYIKRLIGLPGESIMILDGDIYVGQHDADLTSFQVQSKPHYAQEALWRIVYDNDFYPKGIDRSDGPSWRQPWTVKNGSGWNLGHDPQTGRTFHFDNSAGTSTLFFDPDANPSNHPLTDFIAYDFEQRGEDNPVHDLKLSFFYLRNSGTGPLRATLGDGHGHNFAAVITPDAAKLVQINSDGEHEIGSIHLKAGAQPVHVELDNVDYRVALRIDDREVIHTTRAQYHPDIAQLLEDFSKHRQQPMPSIEISADHQACAISHIGLWRDVYYINDGVTNNVRPFAGTPKNIMQLNANEYFVLGDNSLVSEDARYWDVPIDLQADDLHVASGRVPGRFMLGRAFFVYWPAGYKPFSSMPSIAPNFGDMRFIR